MSRATVYRYFPGGREELLHDVVSWEFVSFFLRLYEEVQGAASLEAVMERGIRFAHRSIEEHEVLQRVMQTEPETLLPTLTVESNRIRQAIADFLLPYLMEHGLAPGVDPDQAADFLARMVLSYMASPGRWDLDDPARSPAGPGGAAGRGGGGPRTPGAAGGLTATLDAETKIAILFHRKGERW